MIFPVKSILLAGGLMLAVAIQAQETAPPLDPDKTTVAIEALGRLKGMDLNANPALKNAVLKVLAATRGTPSFVKLVQDFQLKDQNPGLLEVAVKNPADESGIEAAKLLLAVPAMDLLGGALNGTNAAAATRLAEALGNTGDKKIVGLLLPLILETKRDAGLRKQGVRSLARVQEGAMELLKLARADRLAADLKFTAGVELNQVRWPELKAEAAQVLPLPPSKNADALPPVAELLKLPGDAARGALIFRRPEVGCINCHRVNNDGVDFGPALSEIGAKLGKDALLEAILEPSAGISFGYEAWSVELKSGDEAFGLIVSETNDELVMKDARNVPSRLKKTDIARRTQSKLSIMPSGLQQTMSTQELADLLEYLASLKKAAR